MERLFSLRVFQRSGWYKQIDRMQNKNPFKQPQENPTHSELTILYEELDLLLSRLRVRRNG